MKKQSNPSVVTATNSAWPRLLGGNIYKWKTTTRSLRQERKMLCLAQNIHNVQFETAPHLLQSCKYFNYFANASLSVIFCSGCRPVWGFLVLVSINTFQLLRRVPNAFLGWISDTVEFSWFHLSLLQLRSLSQKAQAPPKVGEPEAVKITRAKWRVTWVGTSDEMFPNWIVNL